MALAAQQPSPDKAIRGTLVDQDSGPAGDLSVRMSDHRVYCFRFDGATAVERAGAATGVWSLSRGDTVDVIAEPGPNPHLRRARLVRIVSSRAPAPRVRIAARTRPELFDDLFPRGNLLLAGIVKRLTPGRMILATRTAGETDIRLREDTRYFGEGQEAGPERLSVNSRVFVRAGRNLEDEIEAYQVMWGEILRPRQGEKPASKPAAGSAAPEVAAPRPQDSLAPPGVPYGNQLLY